MTLVALQDANWRCGVTVYELKKGQKVEIASPDLAHAKASGLFDLTIEAVVVEKKKTGKKAE